MQHLKRSLVWLLPLLPFALVMLIGFSQLSTAREDRRRAIIRQTELEASLWRSNLESEITRTVTAANSVAGFVAGGARRVPKHNGTKAERQSEIISPDSWAIFGQELYQANPGIFSLQIQPSAVINQVYPPGTAPIGLDLFQTAKQKQDVYNAIARAGVVVAGPLRLVQGGIGLIVRSPVFLGVPKTLETWWGNGAAIVMVDRFVEGTGILNITQRRYHFVLEFENQNTKTMEMIANNTDTFDKAQVSRTAVRLPNGFQWDLYVGPVGGWDQPLAAGDVAVVIVIGIAAAVFTLLVILAIKWYQRRNQRDTSCAPKSPPVTLIFTDIESSTNLWVSYPQAMGQALIIHNNLMRKYVKEFAAYEVKTVGDSFMIACKTAQMGLDLCKAVQAAFRNEPWPPEIAEFYGVPFMKVRMGVHFCTDVDCVFDEVTKGYDYYGNDVNKTARIESKAVGGEVLISDELAAAAQSLGGYELEAVGEQELKGITRPQMLHRLRVVDGGVSPHRLTVFTPVTALKTCHL